MALTCFLFPVGGLMAYGAALKSQLHAGQPPSMIDKTIEKIEGLLLGTSEPEN
jgi:hypothetical protein